MSDIVASCESVTLRWFEKGEHCDDPIAGDVILVDHGTSLAWAISSGQTLASHLWRHDLHGFTWLDHCAFIRDDVASDFAVSEMGPRGHEIRSLRHYQDRLYCVAHFDVDDSARKRVLASDQKLWGIDYGFIQYAPLVVNGLTHSAIAASYGDSMICSTAVTWCAQNVYFTPDRQAAAMMPSDIAKLVGATRAS